MALTVAALGAALRLNTDPTSPPAEPLLGILHRQLQAATEEVNGYASGAPEVVRDEATIRMVGYLFERPDSHDPFRLSGALKLLSRWHEGIVVPLAPAVTVATPTTPITPESGLQPSHPVHPGVHFRYAGWSTDALISQAELNAATQFTTDVLTVPARATAGYFFFGVESSPGFPDSILLDGNPTNQITNFVQQGGTLDRDGESVVIGVSTAELSAALAGRMWTMGYGP